MRHGEILTYLHVQALGVCFGLVPNSGHVTSGRELADSVYFKYARKEKLFGHRISGFLAAVQEEKSSELKFAKQLESTSN